jgi:hypothetical protein
MVPELMTNFRPKYCELAHLIHRVRGNSSPYFEDWHYISISVSLRTEILAISIAIEGWGIIHADEESRL